MVSNTELEVLRAFYAAVGAELDNWVEDSSVRVLRRAHAMLACAVEGLEPQYECPYEKGPHHFRPDWNTYTNKHEDRCLCGLRKPTEQIAPSVTPVEKCWGGTWHCPHTGVQHIWPKGRDSQCGWCGLKSNVDGVSEPTAVPRRSSAGLCPKGGVHRWEWADDDNGHSGEVCGKCFTPEGETGWECSPDEHAWSDNGFGLVSCDVCPAVR